MKTEFLDVSDTRKQLVVEIPSTVVDAEIDRIARDYSKAARIPGFRPGKVPAKVVRQRFRDQILHDVVHDLIPRAVDDALRERGMEPVDTPDIKDVLVEEGQPLKFTANFETVPAFDPGDYSALKLRRPPAVVEEEAVDAGAGTAPAARCPLRAGRGAPGRGERHGGASIWFANRPDATGRHARGRVDRDRRDGEPARVRRAGDRAWRSGEEKTFPVDYPADYSVKELAGTILHYRVTVKEHQKARGPRHWTMNSRRISAISRHSTRCATRVRADLQAEADRNAERRCADDLLRQLAARVTFDVPDALIEREIERRIEEFVRRLVEQGVDPRQAGIDWQRFRDNQRDPARETVPAPSCSTKLRGASSWPWSRARLMPK